MSKSDDLKNRLDELFSSIPVLSEPKADVADGQTGMIQSNQKPSHPALHSDLKDLPFQTAFEHAAVGMVMTSIDGKLLRLNDAFCKMLGYSMEELKGIGFQTLTLPEDQQTGADALKCMLSGEIKSAQIRKRYLNKLGDNVWVDLNITLIRDEDAAPLYFITIAQNVTAQQRNSQLLAGLNELSRKVVGITEASELMTLVYQFTSHYMDTENFFLALYDRDAQVVSFPICIINHEQIYSPSRPYGAHGLTDFVIENKQTLLLSENVPEEMKKLGIEFVNQGDNEPALSWLGVPILHLNQVIGAIAVQSIHSPGLYGETEKEILEAIAMQVANALFFLNQYKKDQQLIAREAWRSYRSQVNSDVIGYSYRYDIHNSEDSIYPIAMNRAEYSGDEMQSPQAIMEENILAMPLAVRGEVVGTIGIHQGNRKIEADISGDGAELSDEDEEFLEAISEQVSQALERARLMEQTQKSAIELQAVAEVGTATASLLEPDVLLQKVVDLTKERFNLYHAHVYLMDDEEGFLRLTAGAGAVGKSMVQRGWLIPLEHKTSVVSLAGRERKGQIIADKFKDPQYLPNPALPDTRSELAVPIVVADRLLGVFDVQSDLVGRFSKEDIRTFTTLAGQVGVALQNARLYAEQLATVERLRELDNMKSAFLANMSHELRTPLNSILGFSQVISEGLDGPLTELMAADLSLIEKNGKHLLHLINDVLDLARIEAGRISLSLEPTNIHNLLEDVIMASAGLAREKGLELRLVANPDLDWLADVDPIRIRQVFINLIGNSVKFTEKGGVFIQIERLKFDEEFADDGIRVRILDSGMGIPVDKLEEIFEAFSQVDSSTTRKTGGTGLGLPISRRLVNLHRGRLWAESEGIGKGSTFILDLPVHPVFASETELVGRV